MLTLAEEQERQVREAAARRAARAHPGASRRTRAVAACCEAQQGLEPGPSDERDDEAMHMGARPAVQDEETAPSSPIRGGRMPTPDAVTSVVRHLVKSGAEARYEAWLDRAYGRNGVLT